ncbi:MAG: hypothetical protein ACP5RT_00255 [Candidatus Micrarchaeia archaeon]
MILLITFAMGYGLYKNMELQNYTPAAGGTNITSAISSLTKNLSENAMESSMIFMQILILFLFANIGYKFTYLGIKSLGKNGEKEEK